MNPPFTAEQFFEVFGRYNEAIFPAQFGLLALAVIAVTAVLRNWPHRDRIASGVLGGLWLWSGVVYHFGFLRAITPAAAVFGAAFVLQAALWGFYLTSKVPLHFRAPLNDCRTVLGGMLLICALVVYPLLSYASGHYWPQQPSFGAPCPLVLFTFGMLCWSDAPNPRTVLVIPVAWALVATSAALWLDVYEDLALLVAAAIALIVLWPRRKRENPAGIAPQVGEGA